MELKIFLLVLLVGLIQCSEGEFVANNNLKKFKRTFLGKIRSIMG